MSGLRAVNTVVGLIVDRSVPIKHETLSATFAPESSISVTRSDGDFNQIAAACSRYEVSVAVMDISSIESRDRDCVRTFIRGIPSTRLLVHMDRFERNQLEDLLLLGCFGFIYQATPVQAWESIVRAVVAGEMWVDHSVFSAAFQTALAALDGREFTPREDEILRGLAMDSNNQAIAEQMFVAPATIRWHLRRLYAKTGVSSRAALTAYAARHVRGAGLLRPPVRRTRADDAPPAEHGFLASQ